MFTYNLKLAWLSIRKTPVLTLLMVGAIGIGIGLSMTLVTLYYMMGQDPIPQKSDQLYNVRVDSWDVDEPYEEPNEPPHQMTYTDASTIYRADRAFREAPMFKSWGVVEPQNEALKPDTEVFRMTGRDFFAMFDVPFLYGGVWSESADRDGDRVTVISRDYNEKIFGGEDSVGRRLRIEGEDFTVVGVIDEWEPIPKYYDVNNGAFDEGEDIFLPFWLVEQGEWWSAGNNNCYQDDPEPGYPGRLAGECVWIQYWAELRDDTERDEYMSFLNAHTEQQKALGRMPRPVNNRLDDVNEWLELREVVDEDVAVSLGLAGLFLAVCLFNTVGLLLAKFLGRSTETGIRRALGASKGQIFRQQLVEVGLIGLGGGLLGLLLSLGGLKGLQWLTIDSDQLVTMDMNLVAIAIGLALVSALIAGLYPAWRVCRMPPALYLKTQ